jgi:hypothetical protein
MASNNISLSIGFVGILLQRQSMLCLCNKIPTKPIDKLMLFDAILTCPLCKGKTTEIMLENTCQYAYRCPHCQETIKTQKGDCCVFCCYADYPCPSTQISGSSCCG